MHEQNFERQVRQTLDDLSLVPTPPVWDGVAAQIRRKKERRRFFFWLLPVMLIALLATWFLLPEQNTAVPERDVQAAKPARTQPANEEGNTIIAPTQNEDTKRPEIRSENLGDNVRKESSPEKDGRISPLETVVNSKPDKGLPTIVKNKVTNPNINKPLTPTPGVQSDTAVLDGLQARPEDVKQESFQRNEQSTQVNSPADTAASVVKVPPVDTLSSTSDSAILIPKPKTERKKAFEVGVVINLGSSGVTTGLFDGIGEKALADFNSVPIQNSSGGVSPRPPSNIRPGLFYAVGVTTNYKISSRASVSAGLQYQQMNTEINVGSRGDSSFADLRMGTTYFENSFSSPQSKYTNTFHFLSVPISYQYQLHKKAPLYFSAGASFSRLLSTTALHFSPNNNIYYIDSSAMRKNAAGLFTSLTYDVHFKKGFRFEFGPLFQYSLTPTSKAVGTKPQHLYTLGLRSTFKLK